MHSVSESKGRGDDVASVAETIACRRARKTPSTARASTNPSRVWAPGVGGQSRSEALVPGRKRSQLSSTNSLSRRVTRELPLVVLAVELLMGSRSASALHILQTSSHGERRSPYARPPRANST